ncbi:CBS domain-containing protein [Streptomyces sp. DH37]|uniref:CBS domain-containing protein n=1 Tax=Streptomyces sp. DH37 TaxID=3040122 RepID=UPI002442CF98|nr:CBS domain-containing protein [Streptomyces sp. DH37]MDG9702681.1 CBS domain-containing protein [Streptomyces sp. DH37]
MTLVQTHPRSTSTDSAHRTAAEAVDADGPRVWDDMTVEVALSVMAAARTGHLVVCDEDGRRTGLVTRARLTAVRDGSGYTDRVRLRDIADGGGPFASSPTAVAEAGHAVRHRRLGSLPVVDEHGSAPGVLAPSR